MLVRHTVHFDFGASESLHDEDESQQGREEEEEEEQLVEGSDDEGQHGSESVELK